MNASGASGVRSSVRAPSVVRRYAGRVAPGFGRGRPAWPPRRLRRVMEQLSTSCRGGHAMKVGVVREIKPDEYRVALTPAGARELAAQGHEVVVEAGAGVGSAFPDEAYVGAGARLARVDEVWASCDLVLKVKEPLPDEYGRLRAGQILFTYLHLAPARELTEALVALRGDLHRLRDRRDGRRAAAAARADERGRRPPGAADGRAGAGEARRRPRHPARRPAGRAAGAGGRASAAASSATTPR